MTGSTILVVGSLHYDILVEADHLPRRDETAVGRRWYPKFGGKGGNQAVAAAQAGAPARMLGAVGDDEFGRFLRKRLEAEGVDDAHVATLPGTGSGMSVAIMDATGDYAATIVSGANLAIDSVRLADRRLWEDVGFVVLQNEVPESVNLTASTEARKRDVRVLLNAAPARPLSPALVEQVDILVVNSVEAEMMGGGCVKDLASAAAAANLLRTQFPTVIVTAGSNGLACSSANETFEIEAEKVDVVSTHGAGDFFVGSLISQIAQGNGLASACAAASHAAALHVSGQLATQ